MIYDVIIVGGGPSGMSAAIYASRARLKTLLIEKAGCGGQIAITDHLENYPGFEEGINGFELAMKMEKQARTFGCEIVYGEVSFIETEDAMHLRGYCLSSFNKTKNGVAYLYLDKKIQEKYNVSYEEASNMVNTLSTIKGSPMWVLFIEKEDVIRVRLRSRGPIVNELAEKYEGGGHKLASGATLHSKNDINSFLEEADKVIKDYKMQPNSSF